jgi:hypothetical protein
MRKSLHRRRQSRPEHKQLSPTHAHGSPKDKSLGLGERGDNDPAAMRLAAAAASLDHAAHAARASAESPLTVPGHHGHVRSLSKGSQVLITETTTTTTTTIITGDGDLPLPGVLPEVAAVVASASGVSAAAAAAAGQQTSPRGSIPSLAETRARSGSISTTTTTVVKTLAREVPPLPLSFEGGAGPGHVKNNTSITRVTTIERRYEVKDSSGSGGESPRKSPASHSVQHSQQHSGPGLSPVGTGGGGAGGFANATSASPA